MGIRETFSILSTAQSEHVIPALIEALECGQVSVQVAAADALTAHRSQVAYSALIKAYPDLPRSAQEAIGASMYRMHKTLADIIENGSEAEKANVKGMLMGNVSVDALDLQARLLSQADDTTLETLEESFLANVERFLEQHTAQLERAEAEGREPKRSIERDFGMLLGAIRIALESVDVHGSRVGLDALLLTGAAAYPLLAEVLSNKGVHASVKKELLNQLEENNSRPAIDLCFFLLDEDSVRLRHIASALLHGRSGDEAVRNISGALNDMESRQVRHLVRAAGGMPWLDALAAHTDQLTIERLEVMADELDLLPIPEAEKIKARTVFALCRVKEVVVKQLAKLGQGKSDEAAQRLETLVKQADERSLLLFIDGLEQLNSPFLHRVLTPLLSSSNESLRKRAQAALAPAGFSKFLENSESLSWETRAIAGRTAYDLNPQLATEILKKELRSENVATRLRALKVIEAIGLHEEMCHFVVGMISDSDRRVRATVVEILAEVRTTESVRALLRLLSDRDPRVQANAVEAIDHLHRPEFKRVFMPFLKNPHNRVRGNACRALWALGEQELVLPVMRDMLVSSKAPMRMSGAWVLAETGAENAEADIAKAMEAETNDRVKATMQNALNMLRKKLSEGGAA